MPSLLLLLLGAAIGGYGTLIGAGGGFLLVPALLVLFPATEPASVTSLSLAVVMLNALSGSLAYARLHRIDFDVALMLSLFAVPATMLGALVTPLVPRTAFEVTFGVVLLALAAFLIWKPLPRAAARDVAPQAAVPPAPAPGRFWHGAAFTAAVAFLAGLLGIGGSPLQVFVLTRVMHLPVHTAMPTSQFMVLLSAFGGVVAHALSGHFHVAGLTFAMLAGGAVVGAQAGAMLSARLSGGSLVRLMALALLTVGVRMVLSPLL